MKFFRYIWRGYLGSEYLAGVRIGERTLTLGYLTRETDSFIETRREYGERFLRIWRFYIVTEGI